MEDANDGRKPRLEILKKLETMQKKWDDEFKQEQHNRQELKESNEQEYNEWEEQYKSENWPLREAIFIIKMESEPYTQKETDQFSGEIRVG